jgi:hypothetical protein
MRLHLTRPWAKVDRSSNASLQVNPDIIDPSYECGGTILRMWDPSDFEQFVSWPYSRIGYASLALQRTNSCIQSLNVGQKKF